ncbi:MAG: HEAT repeat domain-containing protein [Woeseiaceae bacterium]
MQFHKILLVSLVAMLTTVPTYAQDDDADDRDQLKIAALEALIAAPPEFALPRARKIMQENHSDEVKESALFILSQIDDPEAHAIVAETARNSSGDLQIEAIEMIGIGGDAAALSSLKDIYANGDSDVREAVIEAYLIADDSDSIYELAMQSDGEEFETAVEMLGAMGATDTLRRIRDEGGMSETLIEAYAIAGDYQTLVERAMDTTDPDLQAQAIESLGIVGGEDVGTTLVRIYQSSDDDDIKEAALEGMFIADYDAGLVELYRSANGADEKSEILEYLTHMESDAVWEIIDSALEGER